MTEPAVNLSADDFLVASTLVADPGGFYENRRLEHELALVALVMGQPNALRRVALTWDREFLYLAVEARTFDSFLELFVSNRAGGLTTLEETGEFRRAIQLPFAVNLIALAEPGCIPDVARADDSHAFALVDRGAVPVAMAGTRTGPVGFEMKVPWSMLSLAQPVKLTTVITGEVGTGAGTGFTVNLPLAAGATDADYQRAYDAIAWPILRAFSPQLILVSAGFDAYKDDPLAGMRLEAECFGRLTAQIVAIAGECCDGRVVVTTEGGYHLKGIADSLRGVIAALEGDGSVASPPPDARAPRGEAAIAAVKPHLARYWPL